MAEAIPPIYMRDQDGNLIELTGPWMNGGSSIAVMLEAHAEIHKGHSYTGGKVTTALGDGTSFYIVGQNLNPDNLDIHLTANVAVSADVIVRTLSVAGRTGGSSENSYNRNRGDTNSGVAVWWGATPTTPVVIKEFFVPGGSGPQALGGSGGQSAERIIPVNAWIALQVENVSGQALDHLSIEWDFYLEMALPVT